MDDNRIIGGVYLQLHCQGHHHCHHLETLDLESAVKIEHIELFARTETSNGDFYILTNI